MEQPRHVLLLTTIEAQEKASLIQVSPFQNTIGIMSVSMLSAKANHVLRPKSRELNPIHSGRALQNDTVKGLYGGNSNEMGLLCNLPQTDVT